MSTRRFDAIIFDMNGVLVDDEPIHFQAFVEIMGEMGYPLSEEEYSRYCLGATDLDCFRALLPRIPGADTSPEGLARAIVIKGERYQRILHGAIPWMPGVNELLAKLKNQGFRLALATGAVRREAEMIVSGLAGNFFEVILAAEDIRNGKPDPEPYLTAAAQLGVTPARCLVVEDSIPGMKSARAAGMGCAMITSSYPATAFAGADLVMDDLRELLLYVIS